MDRKATVTWEGEVTELTKDYTHDYTVPPAEQQHVVIATAKFGQAVGSWGRNTGGSVRFQVHGDAAGQLPLGTRVRVSLELGEVPGFDLLPSLTKVQPKVS